MIVHKHKDSFLVGALIVIILGCVTVVILQALGITHLFGTSRTPTTASSYTKGQVSQNSKGSNGFINSTGPSSSTGAGKAVISPALLKPYGNFVSDHTPNLSGTPHPDTINSVCTTYPGATCQITFTMNGTVKSLPSQNTDQGGSTYWSWKLQDLGLATGSWQIAATATYGSQTASTIDPTPLEVGP